MRARNIKPAFFKNEKLVECSIAARLLAPGLWMLADREGRLLDKPKQIKMEIFPADNIDVEQLLSELHTHQHILRYEINGIKCIQILGFKEHQSPHFTEKPSLIPSSFQDDFQKSSPSSHIEAENIQKDFQNCKTPSNPPHTPPYTPPPDSPNPSSLNPDSNSLRSLGASAPEKPTKVKIQGSRLSPDWELEQDWGDWAVKEGLSDDDVIREAQKFRDYWISKAGQGAIKADWEATWRNWIREYLDRRKK